MGFLQVQPRFLYVGPRRRPRGVVRPGSSKGQARVVRPPLQLRCSPCEELWGDSPPCERPCCLSVIVRHLLRSRPDCRETVGPSFCKERMHGSLQVQPLSLYVGPRRRPRGAVRPGSSQGRARVVRHPLRRCRSPCKERWGDSPPCERPCWLSVIVRYRFKRRPNSRRSWAFVL